MPDPNSQARRRNHLDGKSGLLVWGPTRSYME